MSIDFGAVFETMKHSRDVGATTMNNRLPMSTPSKLILAALIASLTLSSQSATAQDGEPSRKPILRIETGIHTASIYRIAVDRAGKFLVTASHDKSARVWETASGRLLRVLRVPIGEGDEGKLYAAAISPDGNTIATSGWTRFSWEKEHSVYLFDRESGRMIRRLGGLPNAVLHLAFSQDGAKLAATLGDTNGVRAWRARDWTEVGRDPNYGGPAYGADFNVAGQLVTTCYDGYLRLYDLKMRLLAKRQAPGGTRPYKARFSPDGRKIAVGYGDSPAVDVLDGGTLTLLYSADTSGANNSLASVAWSADGTMLYAGGTFTSGAGLYPIRRWNDAGRGRYVDTVAAGNTILDIVPLASRSIVFAGGPIWGILDSQHTLAQPSQVLSIADYRDEINSHFLTDANANTLRFGYEQFGRSAAVFKLSERSLTTDAPAANDLRARRTEAPGLSITGWNNTYTVHLNNKPLKLNQYERSRSLAIESTGDRFLLGTNFWIRLFDRKGEEMWKTPSSGVTWNVNISGNGRFALAAYSDGTIRTYRKADGKELLAFFPHADRKRWIVWSPSGYYDASPGAEELIGWHVNNGRDQAADFFAVGQFRSTYYRPDVIAKVLETGDEARALALANEEAGRKHPQSDIAKILPPIVEFISPRDSATISTTEITVRFRVRTPSGEPVTNIKALVDGRPAGATKELVQQGTEVDSREFRLVVPERDSEVSIIAENQFAASVPATVRLKWTGASVPSAKPTLYLLAVGVSRYANERYNLQFADKDARDFVTAMSAQKGLQYKDVVVRQGNALTNEQATKEEIAEGLDWIRKQTTTDDVAMVFFSGHGINNQDQNNDYYFCPYNVDPGSLMRTGVPFSDIKNALSAVKGKVVFLVDSCHAGNSMGTGWRLDINRLINELSSAQNGVLVISATVSSELAYEKPEWNNGAFTKALVEGVNGAAESRHVGRVTFASLVDYVSYRVIELTDDKQHPTLGAQAGQNLAIALTR